MSETNASGAAMGVVLMLKSHFIVYFSKPFCTHLQKASTYIQELHVITS